MSYRRLAEALLRGQPYFGPAMRSLQGAPDRQRCFLPIVRAIAPRAAVEILEVGSWAAGSAISWASALKKLALEGHVTCVDSWTPYFDLERERAGHYERMNHAAEHGMIHKLFQHNVSSSGLAGTIVAKVGKSRDVLPKLPRRRFDIVYLDGSHALDDVLFDVREAKRLVRRGGIVCGDDLECQLKDLDPAEAEALACAGQDYVASSLGAHYHPGVTWAVAREFGEVSAWDGFWAVRFSGPEWNKVTIDLTGSEMPDHVASAAMTVAADTPSHFLIANQGRYFALAKALGTPEDAAELLGDEDLPPLVFTGRTLEEVRRKVQQQGAISIVTDRHPHLLAEDWMGFNIVMYEGRYFGLAQSLGDVDLTSIDLERLSQDPGCIVGSRLSEVTASIAAMAGRSAAQDAGEAERAGGALEHVARELRERADLQDAALQRASQEARELIDGLRRDVEDRLGRNLAVAEQALDASRQISEDLKSRVSDRDELIEQLQARIDEQQRHQEEHRSTAERLAQELADVQRDLRDRSVEIEHLRGQDQTLSSVIDGLTRELVDVHRDLQVRLIDIESLKSRDEALRAEIDRLRQDLEELRAARLFGFGPRLARLVRTPRLR